LRRGPKVGHIQPTCGRRKIDPLAAGLDDADGALRCGFSGGLKGWKEELCEEEGHETVGGELELVALFGHAAEWGQGYACVVPEHVEFGLFGFEVFGGGFDGTEVVELEEEKLERASR
jgi:hypothetical protein